MVDPSVWVAIAQGAGNVLGNVIGAGMTNKRARAAQRRAHNYALQEMDYQYDLNKNAYDYQLQQESPAAIKSRMLAAGLNPNFSDNFGASANFGSTGLSSGPSGGFADLSDLGTSTVGSALQAYQAKLQAQATKSQIALNKALEKQANAGAFNQEQEGEGKRIDNSNKPRQYEDTHQLTWAQVQNFEADKNYKDVMSENIVRKTTAEIELMDKQGGFYAASEKEKDAIIRQINETLPLIKEKYGAETAEKYALAESARAGIKIAWFNAETGRMDAITNRKIANEMVRHNVHVEKLTDDLNQANITMLNSLSDLYGEQKGLVHEQAVYNHLEAEFRRYLRVNGYDDEMYHALIGVYQQQQETLESQEQLNEEEAENLTTRMWLGFMSSIVGSGVQAYGMSQINSRIPADVSTVTTNYNSKGKMTGFQSVKTTHSKK